MLGTIKQLLLDGEFIKSFSFILSELNKSYDLSDGTQREYYQCLSRWKELCSEIFSHYLSYGEFLKINEDICSGRIPLSSNSMRTATSLLGGVASTNATLKFLGKGFVEVGRGSAGGRGSYFTTVSHLLSSKIKTTVIDSNYRNGMDAYINIISKPEQGLSGDSESDCSDKLNSTGNNLISTGKPSFTIIINGSLKEFDLNGFTDAVARSINAITKQKKVSKIGIITDIRGNYKTLDEQRVLFLILLANIISGSAQLISNHEDPNLILLSKDNKHVEIINGLIAELEGMNKIPGLRMLSKKLSAQVLIEKCLTCNAEYKNRLEALAKIIDEPDVPILILGESGVGKSFLAESVHSTSNRNGQAFVSVNCGGISENKLYQTLWGWRKGSFTGAVDDGRGAVQRADGGTLFLDEIDRASREVRDSLLTFIETNKYASLGDTEKTANIRLIFGTNKNLGEQVAKGQFEEDFYNRITQRIIKIPPLRKRKEDIELIISHYVRKFYARKNISITFELEAIEYLKSYSWPGNVRELAQYINQRLLDAWADEEEQVSLQQIMAFPPSGLSFIKENDLETFISSMKNLLDNWDSSKGPFLQEVVAPVLSKLYIEDCFQLLKKTQKNNEAMDIIGISGERGKDSKLQEYYSKFQEIKDKFNL